MLIKRRCHSWYLSEPQTKVQGLQSSHVQDTALQLSCGSHEAYLDDDNACSLLNSVDLLLNQRHPIGFLEFTTTLPSSSCTPVVPGTSAHTTALTTPLPSHRARLLQQANRKKTVMTAPRGM